jgi:hypothetical protein
VTVSKSSLSLINNITTQLLHSSAIGTTHLSAFLSHPRVRSNSTFESALANTISSFSWATQKWNGRAHRVSHTPRIRLPLDIPHIFTPHVVAGHGTSVLSAPLELLTLTICDDNIVPLHLRRNRIGLSVVEASLSVDCVGYVINITHGKKHTQNIPCTRRQFLGGTLWTATSS